MVCCTLNFAESHEFTSQPHCIQAVAPEWSSEEEGLLLQFICQRQKEGNWPGLKDASFWDGASHYISENSSYSRSSM